MRLLPRTRWRRWITVFAVSALALGALFVWRFSPLPNATWAVVGIEVDGMPVEPLGATVTTGIARISFHGCNEIGSAVGGLPWWPRLGSQWTTAMACSGPLGELDEVWVRLSSSSVTFHGAWADSATLRGGGVVMRLRRR